MRRLLWLAVSSLVWPISACKSVNHGENSEEKGIITDLTNPRLARNEDTPWVDWQWHHGARDDRGLGNGGEPIRTEGVAKALIELDSTRVDLVKGNLVDSNGAYGDKGTIAPYKNHKGETLTTKTWAAMQDGTSCGPREMANPLYRARSLDGRCNDFDNPPMGSVGERFARNVSIDSANKAFKNFKDEDGINDPNPREVSSALLRRKDPFSYAPAPFFNLWAGAWIQFMTHDWFAHAQNGNNDNNHTYAVSEKNIPENERVGKDGTWTVAHSIPDDGKFRSGAKGARPNQVFKNQVSHWWDASQVYGWDTESRARARDPKDPAKLRLDDKGLLPLTNVAGVGPQESAAFTDNWWVGLSLLTTTFVREHNRLVDQLRDPKNAAIAVPPSGAKEWSDDELFDVAHLCISALIAKIHTVEWTPQLLFDRPGDIAMHANWYGLTGDNTQSSSDPLVATQRKILNLADAAMHALIAGLQKDQQDALVAISAAGPGIVGMKHTEHFNSPFTLPEEFTAVYRLHSLIPDYIEIYDADAASNGQFKALTADDLTARLPDFKFDHPASRADYWWRPKGAANDANMIAIADTIRGKSRQVVDAIGIDNLALSFGLTPVGQLRLGNFPRFMTDLAVPQAPGGKIDLAAMDILRDRERGIPRFNEFRRQIHLKPLKTFEDFIDHELEHEISSGQSRDYRPDMRLSDAEIAGKKVELKAEQDYIAQLKKLYKNDIEKVDLMVGIGAEFVRPHGYAISETQFQIFILNASRRLFSDRFFTEAYTPEYYTQLGYDYVNSQSMAKVLARTYPKLAGALKNVPNAFEMWNRKRTNFTITTEQRADFLR